MAVAARCFHVKSRGRRTWQAQQLGDRACKKCDTLRAGPDRGLYPGYSQPGCDTHRRQYALFPAAELRDQPQPQARLQAQLQARHSRLGVVVRFYDLLHSLLALRRGPQEDSELTPPTPPRFGTLLKTLRTAAGLTQEALAERAGVSVRGLQDLERGQSQTPRRDTVELLAAALGLSALDRATFVAATRRGPQHRPSRLCCSRSLFAARALVPLVGRARELALLDRILTDAPEPLGSAPRCCWPASRASARRACCRRPPSTPSPRGWRCWWAAASGTAARSPMRPCWSALAQHLQGAEPAQLRAALAGCAWLVRLLPELADGASSRCLPGALPPEQERRLYSRRWPLPGQCGGAGGHAAGAGRPAVGGRRTPSTCWPRWCAPRHASRCAWWAPTATPRCGPRSPLRRAAGRPGAGAALAAQHRWVRWRPRGGGAPARRPAGGPRRPGGAVCVERVLQRAGVGCPSSWSAARRRCAPGHAAGECGRALGPGAGGAAAGGAPAAGRQEVLGVAAVVGRRASRALLLAVAGATGGGRAGRAGGGLPGAAAAGGGGRRLSLRARRDPRGGGGRSGRGAAGDAAPQGGRGAGARPRGGLPGGAGLPLRRGGSPDRAVHYLEQAGDHAWAQRAHAAAEGHYRRRWTAWKRWGAPQEALRVREKLGEVLYQDGPLRGRAAGAGAGRGGLPRRGRLGASGAGRGRHRGGGYPGGHRRGGASR